MKSVRGKIAKAAGLLLVLQVFEQATGLMKQMVIAAQFGTSETMDGYLIATTIVGLILLWVGLPIRQTLIPMFRHDLAKRGERAAWANASVLFNNLLLVLIGIVLLGALIAPYLVSILAPGFDESALSLATSLARITMASVVFVGMGNVLSQIFFSYERFFRPGIVGSVNNRRDDVGTARFRWHVRHLWAGRRRRDRRGFSSLCFSCRFCGRSGNSILPRELSPSRTWSRPAS